MWRWLGSWQVAAASTVIFTAGGVLELVAPSDGVPAWLWLVIGAYNGVKAIIGFRDERCVKKTSRT